MLMFHSYVLTVLVQHAVESGGPKVGVTKDVLCSRMSPSTSYKVRNLPQYSEYP